MDYLASTGVLIGIYVILAAVMFHFCRISRLDCGVGRFGVVTGFVFIFIFVLIILVCIGDGARRSAIGLLWRARSWCIGWL